MPKKYAFATAALALFLAASVYFSPHWAVNRMRAAIEARDYTAFSSYVDFPALRASYKSQLNPANDGAADGEQGSGSVLEALRRGIAGALAGPMVDAVVGTAGVIEMINAGSPAVTQAVITASITQVPTAAAAIPDMQVSYDGWDRAVFQRSDASGEVGSFVLVRDGLWRWKLAAVELPR